MKIDKFNKIAEKLMHKHGVEDFTIKLCNKHATTIAYTKNLDFSITFNSLFIKYALDSQIIDVILHEIAHAIMFKTKPSRTKSHGKEWREVALRVGAIPRACLKLPRCKSCSKPVFALQTECENCHKLTKRGQKLAVLNLKIHQLDNKIARHEHESRQQMEELKDKHDHEMRCLLKKHVEEQNLLNKRFFN